LEYTLITESYKRFYKISSILQLRASIRPALFAHKKVIHNGKIFPSHPFFPIFLMKKKNFFSFFFKIYFGKKGLYYTMRGDLCLQITLFLSFFPGRVIKKK